MEPGIGCPLCRIDLTRWDFLSACTRGEEDKLSFKCPRCERVFELPELPMCTHGMPEALCPYCDPTAQSASARYTLDDCPKCGSSSTKSTGSTPMTLGGDGLTGHVCRACGHKWRR